MRQDLIVIIVVVVVVGLVFEKSSVKRPGSVVALVFEILWLWFQGRGWRARIARRSATDQPRPMSTEGMINEGSDEDLLYLDHQTGPTEWRFIDVLLQRSLLLVGLLGCFEFSISMRWQLRTIREIVALGYDE